MRFGVIYLWRTLTAGLGSIFFLLTFGFVRLLPWDAGPRYLRWFLEACGGGFAKLGQMLAMRFDLLPRGYYEELGHIFDHMPRVKARKVRKILAQDLGAKIFERIDLVDEPLGSASIAQAHCATIRATGEEIVLKVRRPRIEHLLRADMINLRRIAWLLQTLGIFRHRDLTRILREVERYSAEEMDFRREAFSAQAMHDMMCADEVDHYSPRVHLDLCSERVIALERLRGVWLDKLVAAVRKGDQQQLAAWAERGITPARTAHVLYRSWLEQAYHHRLFHADPHAANVLVMDGGTVAYIDFGIVGWLDEELSLKQERLIRHLARGEVHGTYNVLLHLVEADEHRDLTEFESVVKSEMTAYLLRVRNPHATAAEKSTGRVFVAVASAVRRLHLRIPTRLTRFYRGQLFIDELALCLAPDLDPIAEVTAFWTDEGRRRQRARLCESFDLANLGDIAASMPDLFRELADWVRFSLPHVGRSYGRTLSRLEHGILLGLNYARRGLQALGLGAVAILTWRRLGGAQVIDYSDQRLLFVAAAGLLIAYGIGRIGQRMRTLE